MKLIRLQFISVVLIGVLLSWQCVDPPAEPVMPTWDVDVSLPLGSTDYELKELIENNPDLLSVDGDGTIIYSFSDSMQNAPFGDVLSIQPVPATFTFEVGKYTLSPDDIEFDVEVGEYLGLPAGYEGSSPGVEPTTINDLMPEIESIQYMVVESGRAFLTLRNESGVPVEVHDGVTVTNTDDGSHVGNFNYSEIIEPGDTAQAYVDLFDARLYRQLEYDFTFSSPEEDYVEIPDEPVLGFKLEYEELLVKEAVARLPEQELAGKYDGVIVLDDSTYISEVLFSSGVMELYVENSIDVDVPVIFTIPELRSRDNPSQQYSISETLQRGSVNSYVIDMRDWMIRNNSPKNDLSYEVRLGTIEETDDFRTFSSTDAIEGALRTQDPPDNELVIERIEGIIPPTEYKVDETIELDVGEFSDTFEGDVIFGDVRLNLGLFFDGGFNAIADMYIFGENEHGVRDSVAIPSEQQYINAGNWSNVILDKNNCDINEFLSTFVPHFPEELSMRGNIIVNPDHEPGFIDVKSSLASSILFEVPFNFGIQNGLVRDTLSIGGEDDDVDRDSFDYFNYGRLYFETENNIPAGMDLEINLLDTDGNVMRNFSGIGVEPAPVDLLGRANGTAERDVRVLELTGEDIEILRQAEMTELLLYLNTDNSVDSVIFQSTDSINIKMYATFNVRADFN